MAGEQFDKRWYVLGGFLVLAVVIVGIILVSRSGGSSDNSSKTTANKEAKEAEKENGSEESEEAGKEEKTSASCKTVENPGPREESMKKPKQTVKKGEKLTAVVQTNCGSFSIELATKEAPTIANSFAYLAEEGFYDELIFHRIVPGFVIQGGDPQGTGAGGPGYSVVEAPPANLEYTKGVVAMAKTSTAPSGSAGSQFFVVTGENAGLPPEYAYVGNVSKGMKVVETIGELGNAEEKPTQTVEIEKMSIERG
jgi:peptidyl-prolyl cis-trans isomerase B (cyclophilin B)